MEQKRLGVSLRDALNLAAFKGVRVVGGHKGLDRKILHVNVMEVPDIINWVQEGELLFTTLYSLRNEPNRQLKLIDDLADRNLAGLAIKPKRFINEIPLELITKADSHDFPLLQIPPTVSFAEMIEPLLKEIFAFQTDLLHQSELMHTRLLNVVLKGGSLADIVDTLKELLHCSIFILDSHLNTLAPAGADAPEIADMTNNLANTYASQFLVVKSVVAAGRNFGFVVAMEKAGGFTVLDEITLERAATIVALEMLNRLALDEVRRRYRNEFVVGLLAGTFFSEQAARQRAKNNGWELVDQMRVLAFRIQENPSQTLKDRLFRYIGDNFGGSSIFGEIGQDVVLVIPLANECCQDMKCLGRLHDEITRMIGTSVLVGIGRDTRSVLGIPASFRQATIAVRLATKISSLGPIVHYDRLGVYRLLDELSPLEVRAFVIDNLQPLLNYEKKEKNFDLLNTLEKYFAFDGNISQVAKSMYVHYNTVVYRLERIDKILGVPATNSEHRLSIELALKAREFLEYGD